MTRPIAVLGAPSSIGIRPYDDGTVRHLDQAPAALRAQRLVERLSARDLGDVPAPPYIDLVRPSGRPRNEQGVARYSFALAERVASAAARDFMLVLGGDCSIVLGCLLGFRRTGRARVGLIYLDAHSDFATPEVSRTGSAASMCLALAVGRGDTPLARLGGKAPLVAGSDVILIGRRDQAEGTWYGQDTLESEGVLDLPSDVVKERGPQEIARTALQRFAARGVHEFWIHLDADVFDPAVVPAVDSPEPDGIGLDHMADLLRLLLIHPGVLGLELTIYDPALDPDRSSATRLTDLLVRVLGGNPTPLVAELEPGATS